MVERIMVMRHFKDQDNLFYENNSPVVEDELLRVKNIAAEIAYRATEDGFNSINLITSNKARAEMTTRAVANRVALFLPTTYEIDTRIRELDQGKYVLPGGYKPGDHFQPLQDAWGIFFKETFSEENILYRFGDPVSLEDGSFKYPQIAGAFEECGENQIEFSIRFYSFISDLCGRFGNSPEALPLVVTHQALAARIAELGHIMNKLKNNDIERPIPGSMPRLEWQAFQEIRDNTEMFIEFGGIATMGLSDAAKFVDILNSEVNHLRSLQTKNR